MAARRKYPTPPSQMLELAREGIRRGLSFEEWWLEAVRPGISPVIVTTTPKHRWTPGCVVWPSDSQENIQWREATEAMRDGWRRAYEGMRPEPREAALKILAPLLAGAIVEDGGAIIGDDLIAA